MTDENISKFFSDAAKKRWANATPEQKAAQAAKMLAGRRKQGKKKISQQAAAAGRKGGAARAAKLTAEERTEIATKAGKALKPRNKSNGESQ